MCPPRRSRRSLLRASGITAAALATGGLAGCLGNGDGPTESSRSGTPTSTDTPTETPTPTAPAALDGVPSFADAVATVDVEALLNDEGLRSAASGWFDARAQASGYEGPTSLSAALEALETSAGFDLRELSTVTAFFTYGDEQGPASARRNGYVLRGDWDESAALALVGATDGDYTERSYGGHTVHEPAIGAEFLGVLGDGRYVVGGEGAIEGTIDVARGAADPADGAVVDAYRGSVEGPIRSATTVRKEWFPETAQLSAENTVDLGPVRSVETAAASFYRDGSARGIAARLTAPDAATARELVEVLRSLRSLATGGESRMALAGYLKSLVADAEIGRDGATVTVTAERTVGELEELAQKYSEATMGVGDDTADAPAVSFDFEYDDAAGTVTITHEAGEMVQADRLYVRGEGFADAADADMTAPGQWAGTKQEDGSVAAGDSVVVGVRSDFTIKMVWEGEEMAWTVDKYDGPDA